MQVFDSIFLGLLNELLFCILWIYLARFRFIPHCFNVIFVKGLPQFIIQTPAICIKCISFCSKIIMRCVFTVYVFIFQLYYFCFVNCLLHSFSLWNQNEINAEAKILIGTTAENRLSKTKVSGYIRKKKEKSRTLDNNNDNENDDDNDDYDTKTHSQRISTVQTNCQNVV